MKSRGEIIRTFGALIGHYQVLLTLARKESSHNFRNENEGVSIRDIRYLSIIAFNSIFFCQHINLIFQICLEISQNH